MDSELERMREKVAEEYGFALYRQYGEEQAAFMVGIDYSTLKRWREEGRVHHVDMGPRKKRYFGFQIADILLGRGLKAAE